MMPVFKLWPSKRAEHERFEILIKPHINRLYKLAYRLTEQYSDAEDLVQDVVLKLYPRLTELTSVEKLSPWLSRVLYRQFIDQQRALQRSPLDYTDDEQILYADTVTNTLGPLELLESELTQDKLQEALEQLNPQQRLVLLLHDLEGYTLEEIHYMQDTAVGTLKSRLHRSRNKLQEILSIMEPFTDAERVNS